MRKNQTLFLHSSSAVSEAVSPDAGLRMETLSSELAKGNIDRRTRERIIPSASHFDTCVFESINWYRTTNIHNSAHSIRFYLFEYNAGVIQVGNTGRSPHLKYVARTHCQFGLLFERLNLDHSLLTNCGRTTIGGFSFEKQIIHHNPVKFIFEFCGKSDDFLNQMMSTVFIASFSFAQLQERPKRCIRWWHNPVCWPVWESIAIKRMKIRFRYGWSFDFGTIEQLWFSVYWRQEESSCRDCLSPDFNKLVFRVKSSANTRVVRQIVLSIENGWKCTKQKFTLSQIPSRVCEKERWRKQRSSSPTDGTIISSNTGNLQRESMETIFSSYSTFF